MIERELGNRDSMANSYHQLGVVAQKRGSNKDALEWYRKAFAIREELGNRAGMADSYHQMGNVSYLRQSYDEALAWYRKALAIREELGNHAGMADSFGQLAIFFTDLGKPEEALPYGLRCLALFLELQSPNIPLILGSLIRQRELLGEDRFRQQASQHLDANNMARVVEMLDRFAAEESDQ